ncbi:GatB/YqeY domain-containing protein [Chloroflexota bacterium]
MALQDKLMDDLKAAMRSSDKTRQMVIRMLRSAIHNAEIAHRSALDDSAVLGVIAKEAKQRKESIAEFERGGAP